MPSSGKMPNPLAPEPDTTVPLQATSALPLADSLIRVWDEYPDAIAAVDLEWRYQYLNAAALLMLGLTPDAVGRDCRELHPDAGTRASGPVYARVMTSRVWETVEQYFEPRDTYLNVIVTPWPDSGVVVVLRDVTAERRPQVGLQQSLDLYEQVLNHTTQSLAVRDLDSRFVLVNRAAATRLGRPVEEIVGMLSSDVLPPEVDQAIQDADQLVRETGLPQTGSAAQLLHPERSVVSQTFPVRDDAGLLTGFGMVVADVTELVEAQAELAASQRRFRRVFASTSLGVIVTREDGEILEVNSALCRMLGYSRDALLRLNGAALLPTIEAGAAAHHLQARHDGAAGYEIEDHLVRSDGELLPVFLTVNTFEDPAGRGGLVSCVVRDLTELRQLQAQLVDGARMEAVGRLAAGIAHDANNILAAVSGYAEQLADEVEGLPVAKRQVDGIVRSVERAGDMVAGLLAFTHDRPVDPILLDLAGLVLDLEDMLRRVLPSGVRLEVDLQPALARVDPSHIRRVLLNLVVNAGRAVEGSGTVRITVRQEQGLTAIVSVADDGHGMTAEVLRRCFEPFFTTRPDSGGTGIGLSTAQGIAQQSGGDLRVTSAPGHGTTFELVLPLAQATVPSSPLSGSGAERRDATILVADDDQQMRQLMQSTLEAAGYRVLAAADGVQALGLADGADLVVSDLHMPGLTGWELTERLRAQSPLLRVLLVSGDGRPRLNTRVPFLAKPFSRAALVRAVGAALAADQ